MRRWHLTEHDSYLRDIWPCFVHCHETSTTDGAFFIHKWYITMLWPFSWDDTKRRSMFHILDMNYHDPSVFMRRCKLTEHVSYMNDILQCSDPCHAMKTTDRACFTPYWWITMLWPLSWDDDNWRSIFLTWVIYYYALTFVIWWWQLTEHASYLRYDKPCSVRCRETMKTDGACFIHEWYVTMLWPLSCHEDDWQSMFHTLWMNTHTLTVVMRQWQLTELISHMNGI